MRASTTLGNTARLLILASAGFAGCSTASVLPGDAGGAGGTGGAGEGVAGRENDTAGTNGNVGAGAISGSSSGEGGRNDGGAGSMGAGTGGDGAVSGGDGGDRSVGGEAGDQGNGGGGEGGCGAGVVPTVLLLIDNSSSMFSPRESLWDPVFDALMKPTDGIVATFQSQVRFGFTSYRGTARASDPQCPILFEVDYELDNFEAINARYSAQSAEWNEAVKWETPTGAAIAKVAEKLAASNEDPPGPKYIVLVTDGSPNTCAVLDPSCGSDEAIKAVQEAKALGITTFVIGMGELATNDQACEQSWGSCGADFMQDMANAGQGLPVHAPPDSLKYQACFPTQELAASYAGEAEVPGTASYYTATNATQVDVAFREVLSSVLTCN